MSLKCFLIGRVLNGSLRGLSFPLAMGALVFFEFDRRVQNTSALVSLRLPLMRFVSFSLRVPRFLRWVRRGLFASRFRLSSWRALECDLDG